MTKGTKRKPAKITARRKAVDNSADDINGKDDWEAKIGGKIMKKNDENSGTSASKMASYALVNNYNDKMEPQECSNSTSVDLQMEPDATLNSNDSATNSDITTNQPGDWNEMNDEDEHVINKVNKCDNIDNFSKCDKIETDKLYLNTDKGPFLVHVVKKRKADEEENQDIHDLVIGMKLKNCKVKGVIKVKKVSRKEVKITFSSKEFANEFLQGNIPNGMNLNAFIPRYNRVKDYFWIFKTQG